MRKQRKLKENSKRGFIGLRIGENIKVELMNRANKLNVSLTKLIESTLLNQLNIRA